MQECKICSLEPSKSQKGYSHCVATTGLFVFWSKEDVHSLQKSLLTLPCNLYSNETPLCSQRQMHFARIQIPPSFINIKLKERLSLLHKDTSTIPAQQIHFP